MTPLTNAKRELVQKALASPGASGRLGIRAVEGKRGAVKQIVLHIDPADYTCSRLAAELADEWVEYVTATEITGWAVSYRSAIHRFCTAMDTAAGPAASELTLARPGLVDLLVEWERGLPKTYTAGSKWPGYLSSGVRTLIIRRDDHADRKVDPALARLVRGPITISWGESSERDEFTRAEKRAMVRAAWQCVRAMETRVERGWELADNGRHPNVGSWTSIADLLWALAHGDLQPREIRMSMPPSPRWPEELRKLALGADGTFVSNVAKHRLMKCLVAMLYPTTLDLHAFRVLLIDATGHAPEELTQFGTQDVEFLPKGVRLTLTKNRASRMRHRAFYDANPSDVAADTAGDVFSDQPRREASEVVRRLMAATERVRQRAPQITDSLFVRAVAWADGRLVFDKWNPLVPTANFSSWLGVWGVTVSGEAHVGRLRKSTKVEKAIVTGGRISGAADDHTQETFAGHYAQGTTLRILSGQVINTAQEHWFNKALAKEEDAKGPTVVTPEAADQLQDPDQLQALGLAAREADGIIQGQLDMGVTHCRNPWESPFSPAGELCSVAPLRCLECRNAWILPSQLPQLLLFEEHLERLRRRLPPKVFTAQWGQSFTNLRAVLAGRSDADKTLARKHIEAGRESLNLPLAAHVEFDA
ncbi:MAG TPA: hypothetical protein VN520_19795 [Streptomyces sp.]|uniref:hypothetical protein n=1 Tax=Streptomyces sp. TaxID=1931 RepID=UPI002CEBC3B9|nr:hypothetical protein [Streptomyces sp.]HWU08590.1 hypothetical protein [Streptomyces sp.]